jgi:hypothetical protein
LPRGNYTGIKLKTFRQAVPPIFQLFQALFLLAGGTHSHRTNALGPFRFG